ncbi:MAG: phosphotransferase [Rhodospirillales bacterium]|nr:phosphotransferase [Rhodospirillales bacterium]
MTEGESIVRQRRLTAADLRFTPPQFAKGQLLRMLAELYGESGSLEALEGERDQNHRLTTPNGRRFVVKVSGALEDPGVVDFQIKALLHLERTSPDLPVPRLHRTLAGTPSGEIVDERDVAHVVRVLSYLPGVPFQNGRAPSRRALREIGAFLARLCQAFSSFNHPSSRHFMPWDITNGLVLNEGLWHDAQADILELAGPLRRHFQEDVLPKLGGLRAQVIHNDGHYDNFLRPDDESDRVAGLIDFGDMIHAPLVCEVAVSASSFLEGRDDPVEDVACLVQGFHEELPLAEDEVEILYDLMLLRTVLSVLLVDFMLRTSDEPSVYLTGLRPEIFDGLRQMLSIGERSFTDRFRAACHRPPSTTRASPGVRT